MDGAKQTQRMESLAAFLAGLQAGWLGVLGMLFWLGVSAAWQQRSFWTAENLMSSAFYGNDALHPGFGGHTISGLALYMLLYSVLGGFLAWVLRDRLARIRVLLASLVFALAWYYFSYHVLWRTIAPLVSLLHVERATMLGHLVYGTLLGRYPIYLEPPPAPQADAPQADLPPAPVEAPVPAAESADAGDLSPSAAPAPEPTTQPVDQEKE